MIACIWISLHFNTIVIIIFCWCTLKNFILLLCPYCRKKDSKNNFKTFLYHISRILVVKHGFMEFMFKICLEYRYETNCFLRRGGISSKRMISVWWRPNDSSFLKREEQGKFSLNPCSIQYFMIYDTWSCKLIYLW